MNTDGSSLSVVIGVDLLVDTGLGAVSAWWLDGGVPRSEEEGA